MTNRELNRDIKKLAKKELSLSTLPNNDSYFDTIDTFIKPEFKRLYNADNEFKAMNKASVLIMLRLNLRHVIVQLHHFGLNLELEELV